jgi:lipopolysaccharide export system permease protein
VKILSRYVLREHLGPLAFALTALTSLLLLNFIAKRFGDLVGKGLPTAVIAEFFALALPFTVAMTLPMAVLVAVLYAFSRLASESEITALKASGVSMGRILRPVLGGATVLAIGMVYFNDYILPAANHRLRILQTDIGRTKPTFALREQVVNEVVPGRLFLKATSIDKAKSILHEVVIYDFGDGSKRRTIVADSGDLMFVPGTGDMELVLFHGTMTEIPAAQPTQMQRLSYARDRITVRGVANSFSRDSADNFRSEREMGVCEMQAQVFGAEKDLYRETRSAGNAQARALKALTRGIVDPVPPPDTLKRSSPGIGRFYCDATTALAGFFGRGDTTAKRRGTPTQQPVIAGTVPKPVIAPNDKAAKTVAAGVPAVATPPVVTPPAPPIAAPQPPSPMAGPPPLARGLSSPRLKPTTAVPPRAIVVAPSSRVAAAAPVSASPPINTVSTAKPVPAPPSASAVQTTKPIAAPPSSGTSTAPEPAPASPSGSVTPSVVSNGIGSLVEQTIQRASIARSTWSQYEVEIHKKFSLAVACIVFVLLGAPIALRFPRGGVGLVIGASLGVFALYYMCLIAGESMADDGVMPPWIAMWGANLIFTLVGLGLFARMGREGSTARGGDLDDVKDRIIAWFASLRPSARRSKPVTTPVPAKTPAPVPATDR